MESRHDVILIGDWSTSDHSSSDDGPPERCSRAPPRIRSRYEEGEVWYEDDEGGEDDLFPYLPHTFILGQVCIHACSVHTYKITVCLHVNYLNCGQQSGQHHFLIGNLQTCKVKPCDRARHIVTLDHIVNMLLKNVLSGFIHSINIPFIVRTAKRAKVCLAYYHLG